MKQLPTCSHHLGSPLLPVKAILLQPRLPGQHKGKLQPSADPFLSFNDLQTAALTFAPQIFLLLGKNWTNLLGRSHADCQKKAGSPVPRTPGTGAVLCVTTLFLP